MKFEYLWLPIIACAFISCGNELDPMGSGNHRSFQYEKPAKKYTMKLSLGGDFITESEEPLFRADDSQAEETSPEGNTYVGINVTRTLKTPPGQTKAQPEKYAYGVFKYAKGEFDEDLSIELSSGYTYNFEATALTEWTDKVVPVSTKMYTYPFRLLNSNSTGQSFDEKKFQKFIYTYEITDAENIFYLGFLKSGRALVSVNGDHSPSNGEYLYPRVKRFYGSLDNFDPEVTASENEIDNNTGNTTKNSNDNGDLNGVNSGDVSNISAVIPLEYKCFGIQINITSLPEGSTLTVEGKKYTSSTRADDVFDFLIFPKNLSFNSNSEPWEGIFSMKNMNAETDNISLKFILIKETGESETIGAKFSVKPKFRKILNVNITENETKTDGNIKIKLSEDNLTNDPDTIPILESTRNR